MVLLSSLHAHLSNLMTVISSPIIFKSIVNALHVKIDLDVILIIWNFKNCTKINGQKHSKIVAQSFEIEQN